jgi:hypothetical protein
VNVVRRLFTVGLVLSAVTGTVLFVAKAGRPRPVPTPPVPGPAALVIDGGGPVDLSTLDRYDRTAAGGPWTVVVRRTSGWLGHQGAVVTFPVGAPAGGQVVTVGTVSGKALPGTVVWPLDGAYARIRGDLGEPELVALAARTTVVAGRPSTRPPPGYVVVSTGPYRPPSIHETRYGTVSLGEQAALGSGLTYTGVASGGGFEDQLYATPTGPGGLVRGRPAVVSRVFGGNATLAWEPAAGTVAYVGYSGAELNAAAVAALQRLAMRTRPLSSTQWQSTRPQTADQTNEPG